MPGGPIVRTAHFAPDLRSVRAARHFVRDELGGIGIGEPPMDAAVLLTSEVVSNAIVHAGTEIDLRLLRQVDRVRVEVHDGDAHLPTPSTPTTGATNGRGLLLLEALALRWGVDGFPDGKTVWFELPTSS